MLSSDALTMQIPGGNRVSVAGQVIGGCGSMRPATGGRALGRSGRLFDGDGREPGRGDLRMQLADAELELIHETVQLQLA